MIDHFLLLFRVLVLFHKTHWSRFDITIAIITLKERSEYSVISSAILRNTSTDTHKYMHMQKQTSMQTRVLSIIQSHYLKYSEASFRIINSTRLTECTTLFSDPMHISCIFWFRPLTRILYHEQSISLTKSFQNFFSRMTFLKFWCRQNLKSMWSWSKQCQGLPMYEFCQHFIFIKWMMISIFLILPPSEL